MHMSPQKIMPALLPALRGVYIIIPRKRCWSPLIAQLHEILMNSKISKALKKGKSPYIFRGLLIFPLD